ncbi:MAG: ROK family transcriptional regulator [Anaerolineales bacterium]|nr:ROK family transcriptional regulator [Anaerolineales bacterium]
MKKATHQQTKQHNRDLVLRTIFSHESISRAEIARVTNLTRTTVSDVVSGLLKEGLVDEVGRGESLGGKTPILLSVVPDARHLIGLNLGQDKFIGAIVNLRGEIKETVEIKVNDSDGDNALELIYQILDQLFNKDIRPIVGIGVGTPGLVNTREGVIVNAVNLAWKDLPLAGLLEEKYKTPVSILNDSQATAIGEFVYGGEHAVDENLIVVNIQHGIGAGILVNGRLFQGDGGGAGEIGHVVVQEDGLQCRCGKFGCLETVAGARALMNQVGVASFDQVVAKFSAENEQARKVVTAAGKYLGISLANLIGILNIQKIVLTGDMIQLGDLWFEAVKNSIRKASLEKMYQGTKLELGKLDYRACILGASAFLMLDDYSLLFQENTHALN